jgi:hypothetical protein
MKNYNNFDSNELEPYGELAFNGECKKMIDERNARKVMQEQFYLIKEQQREIVENRKSSKRSLIIAIIGIIISFASLIVAIIALLN